MASYSLRRKAASASKKRGKSAKSSKIGGKRYKKGFRTNKRGRKGMFSRKFQMGGVWPSFGSKDTSVDVGTSEKQTQGAGWKNPFASKVTQVPVGSSVKQMYLRELPAGGEYALQIKNDDNEVRVSSAFHEGFGTALNLSLQIPGVKGRTIGVIIRGVRDSLIKILGLSATTEEINQEINQFLIDLFGVNVDDANTLKNFNLNDFKQKSFRLTESNIASTAKDRTLNCEVFKVVDGNPVQVGTSKNIPMAGHEGSSLLQFYSGVQEEGKLKTVPNPDISEVQKGGVGPFDGLGKFVGLGFVMLAAVLFDKLPEPIKGAARSFGDRG